MTSVRSLFTSGPGGTRTIGPARRHPRHHLDNAAHTPIPLLALTLVRAVDEAESTAVRDTGEVNISAPRRRIDTLMSDASLVTVAP